MKQLLGAVSQTPFSDFSPGGATRQDQVASEPVQQAVSGHRQGGFKRGWV